MVVYLSLELGDSRYLEEYLVDVFFLIDIDFYWEVFFDVRG